jgi:sugar phosphate isomerase/epimerase
MFSISTAWNIEAGRSVPEAISEINSLGFDALELAWINEEKLEQLKKTKFKAGSVHSYLPEPMKLKEGRWRSSVFNLTALDENERLEAIKWTKRTIDTAAEMSAPAVVVHLGNPEGMENKSYTLKDLYAKGKKESDEFVWNRDKLLFEREEKRQKTFQKGLKSLSEVNVYAVKAGVKIGLETRLHYEEHPNSEEFEYIFKEFEGGALYYWHDIGHAIIQERLGFVKPKEHLSLFSERLIGLHIHDVKGIEDHSAPGMGDVEYEDFVPYFLEKKILKVFEVHAFCTKEQVLNGKRLLERLVKNGAGS